MWLIAVLLVAGAACFGAIATAAERSRSNAANAARSQTERLLIQAVNLYKALADANATVTATFLTGGVEQPALRQRYLQDLTTASTALATLTHEVGQSTDAGAAVGTIIEQLPIYSGLVETARANNRQGLPVGAAYLRQASGPVLANVILPAADRLYAAEAKRLSDDYRTGTGTSALVVLLVVAAVALALLALTQYYLTRITKRVLNVPFVIATVVLSVVVLWSVIGLLGEKSALESARRASDSVEVLSATRVLLSRAESDESLTLVNRGSDKIDPLDFTAVIAAIGSPSGLLSEVSALAKRAGTGTAARQLVAEVTAYRAETSRIKVLQTTGQIKAAIDAATSPASTAIANDLSTNLRGQINAAQRRFGIEAADATSSLSGLSIAIPLLTALAAALALLGLRQRLQEYR